MDVVELISRARAFGELGISAADREAFRYRPGEGRRLRSEIADRLLLDFGPSDLPLLRALMQEETLARRINDGCGRVLFALATMLYALGEVEDVLRLHAAKFANMDAGSMIEHYMLRMGRPETELAAFVRERLAKYPTDSSWPVERVLRDVHYAFVADDFEDRDACLRTALQTLQTVYAEDVLDEDTVD